MEASATVPPYVSRLSTHVLLQKIAAMSIIHRLTGGERSATLTILLSMLLVSLHATMWSQRQTLLSVSVTPSNELVLALPSQFLSDYGCAYPITYQLGLPRESGGWSAERWESSTHSWVRIEEKTSNDLYNGVEAVRFDAGESRAYVSAAFSQDTDTLQLRIRDSAGITVYPRFEGITRYYDNRRAAVSVSADDFSDWGDLNHRYCALLNLFRSHGLSLTVGVISGTAATTRTSWNTLQQQIDLGNIEVAAHSRTHPDTPYVNGTSYESEIFGCSDDLVNNLRFSAAFRRNSKQYVYTWIAPYGSYDRRIDSLLQIRKYLVPRLYGMGDSAFSEWNSSSGLFRPCNPTLEIGKPSWGGGDTDRVVLNRTFDSVLQRGGLYHFMWHPQVLAGDIDKAYLRAHLSHVSNRRDVLYATVGQLYLYRLIEQANTTATVRVNEPNVATAGFALEQNFPNPFNPSTTIPYVLAKPEKVSVAIFDVLGRVVHTVLDDVHQAAGPHRVDVDMRGYASGVYFYGITTGRLRQMKPMFLLK